MAAYLIGHITVKDKILWQEYVAGVKDSLVSVLAGKYEFQQYH